MNEINKTLKGIKVMVIDDSSTIRKSAEIFLKHSGCEVILAEDGFEAMHKIVDNQPDIIFIDIGMPRLDGYQACMLIKKTQSIKRFLSLCCLVKTDCLIRLKVE